MERRSADEVKSIIEQQKMQKKAGRKVYKDRRRCGIMR
jgi:hypothetical protein